MIASPKEKECIEFAIKLKVLQEIKKKEEKKWGFFLKGLRFLGKKEMCISDIHLPSDVEYQVGTEKTLLELWSLYGFSSESSVEAECLNFWVLQLHIENYDVYSLMNEENDIRREQLKRWRKRFTPVVEIVARRIDEELGSYTA
jgi:hypothetical protein